MVGVIAITSGDSAALSMVHHVRRSGLHSENRASLPLVDAPRLVAAALICKDRGTRLWQLAHRRGRPLQPESTHCGRCNHRGFQLVPQAGCAAYGPAPPPSRALRVAARRPNGRP